ncbi:hypothetical protein R3P38DRAFT_3153577 [Favolaschia claudopus]|uniref:Uncharacterized protein n=1 Tax=Favolaschia claudopus TaxID=2862362 RepID=A0AAV9YZZ7_9AGAR
MISVCCFLNLFVIWRMKDPADFRRIRWGDVYLQRQLYMDGRESNQGFSWERHRSCVRIVRSAKIDGRDFTVATYRGNNAEREWKEDVERYMDIRHESILQLYGTVRRRNMWATVFHCDFVPYEEFLKTYQHCAILTCYIRCCAFASVDGYLASLGYPEPDPDLLINSSNGRLSVDIKAKPLDFWFFSGLSATGKLRSCLRKTSAPSQKISLGIPRFFPLLPCIWGDIYCLGNDNSLEVVATLQPRHRPSDNINKSIFKQRSHFGVDMFNLGYRGTVISGGWRRCQNVRYTSYNTDLFTPWLSQANHIFGRLSVKSMKLGWSGKPSTTSLDGFLFLGPERDFVTGSGAVKWPPPERWWYWSLYPSGIMGRVCICGLREFHEASGFDPESQDTAVKLGEPLYELSSIRSHLLNAQSLVITTPWNFARDSGSGTKNSAASEAYWLDLDKCGVSFSSGQISEDVDTLTTEFNENGEFTGPASTSASFIPLVDPSICPPFDYSMDAGPEDIWRTSTSQTVSAWVESLQNTTWDNQNLCSDSFDTTTPHDRTRYSNAPIRSWPWPWPSRDDPQTDSDEEPSNSRKGPMEDNDSASGAKRAQLEY